jgi:hypothetical protein
MAKVEPRETVRKGSKEHAAWPHRDPKAPFVLRIPAKFVLGAVLIPLFGQFLEMDYEGIKTLLQRADGRFPRLSHLWLDAAYRGEDKGKDWVEKTL